VFRRHLYSIVIAIACVVVAVLYGALAPLFGYKVEWAGVTMLIALGAALGIMFSVLDIDRGE